MTKYTRATPDDIARIWKQLWGDLTPEQAQEITKKEDEMEYTKFDLKVGNHLYTERGELLDDALYAEMNNLTFPKAKSDRLAEVSEQIRLIENITHDNQASYFDPRTAEEKAADAELQDEQATRADLRTGFQQF